MNVAARKRVYVVDPWISCREQFDKPSVGHFFAGTILQSAKLRSMKDFIGNTVWIGGHYYTMEPENVVELHS